MGERLAGAAAPTSSGLYTGGWWMWHFKRMSHQSSRPDWPQPTDLGSMHALQSFTTVAAPLLAGFSLTIAAVVLTDADKLRWPGAAALAAIGGAVFLIAAVQFGGWARQHAVTPDDYRSWFDDADANGLRLFVREMERQHAVYRIHKARAQLTYNIGIILLLLAIGVAVAPTAAEATQVGFRWIAAVIAWLAALVEALWTGLTCLAVRNRVPRFLLPVLHTVLPRP